MTPSRAVRVAIDTPVSGGAAGDGFDYRWRGDAPLEPGALVLVPFGARAVVGVVVDGDVSSEIDPGRMRDVVARVADVPPLSPDWLALARFAARYYHRPLGEVVLPALPMPLRRAAAYAVDADDATVVTLPAAARAAKAAGKATAIAADPAGERPAVTLNAPQAAALERILASRAATSPRPILLQGITGSGKTEVYLRAVEQTVADGRQALLLVPEINLTPQLLDTVRRRLPGVRVASLHSGHATGHRLHRWLLAHRGDVDVLLGTRLAVLASLPRLGLIVVDEEHDASYKQREGLRYSARDLAIARARQGLDGRPFPVVLASATPSVETWAHAESGRYERLVLNERAVAEAALPTIRLVPTLRATLEHGLTTDLRDAIADRLARGEPTLVFHNRRGYAPVVACGACGWLSACPRCSVNAVFHKADRELHCHHCGWQHRVPRACPQCGNADLAPLGRGTQRVEESLQALFPTARVARIDRDSTRRKGVATGLLDAVHRGELDILVGTQMLAKGHDFRNVTLVCVLDADSALYSHDFRAAERLFSNLMQVAGRAGRGAGSERAEVLIQTRSPEHPLFAALIAHDFDRFAASQLVERRAANLPPFSHQAVLRAEATSADDALACLAEARRIGDAIRADTGIADRVVLYDPVPMVIARVADVERAQVVIEANERPPLHALLDAWLPALRDARLKARWHVEVDPIDI